MRLVLDTIGLRGAMTLQELRDRRREEILRVAASRGARNVRVFGSVARGDSDEKSDVDFLVEMEPGRTLFDLSGLLLDLEVATHVSVDVVTEPAFAHLFEIEYWQRLCRCERMTGSGSATFWRLLRESRSMRANGVMALRAMSWFKHGSVHHLMIVGEACRALRRIPCCSPRRCLGAGRRSSQRDCS